MRIALVTDYYLPTLGGVQTVVKAHREELISAGHEVTVYCPLHAPSDDAGIVRVPTSRVFRPDGYPFAWPPKAVRQALVDSFRERKIDVVHVHSEMFTSLGAILAARELGLGVVQTMHGRVDQYTQHVLPLPQVTTMLLAFLHRRNLRIPHDM